MTKYPLTVIDKIEAFLIQHCGRAYCDECVRLLIGLKRRGNTCRVIRKLGRRVGFAANRAGECSTCFRKRYVIQARGETAT